MLTIDLTAAELAEAVVDAAGRLVAGEAPDTVKAALKPAFERLLEDVSREIEELRDYLPVDG